MLVICLAGRRGTFGDAWTGRFFENEKFRVKRHFSGLIPLLESHHSLLDKVTRLLHLLDFKAHFSGRWSGNANAGAVLDVHDLNFGLPHILANRDEDPVGKIFGHVNDILRWRRICNRGIKVKILVTVRPVNGRRGGKGESTGEDREQKDGSKFHGL